MPAADFLAMISSPAVLGDPTLKTQHFCGGSKWEMTSPTEVIGWHQLRVPHQRYTDESLTTVAMKGHAHSTNQHWYRKIDGVWKFAGLKPDIRWGEYDFERIFEGGRENFAEGTGKEGGVDGVGVEEEKKGFEMEKMPVNVDAAMAVPLAV